MIKINKTLGLALLTALAASCSSDNDVAPSNNPTIENGESAFASLRINLPAQQGTRAAEYADGLASEYNVYDGTLLVFKKAGTSEGDYTFVQHVDLGNMTPWLEDATTGISTSANVTVQLDKTSYADLTAGSIYGLVILNNGTGTAQKITLPTDGQTFSAWNVAGKVNATNMLATSNGIVMANAPRWTAAGTTPTTLVQIVGANVKPTKALADGADPAADFFVERGLAKVTMLPFTEKNPTGSGYTSDKVAIDAWTLDVTNTKSFPVHNVDLATSYGDIWKEEGTGNNQVVKSDVNQASINRFHDATTNVDESTYFRRVYWGKDPNYDKDSAEVSTDFTYATSGSLDNAGAKNFGKDYPQYCLENTFDIAHMKQSQTTRVLFKATYKLGGTTAATFYKIDGKKELYSAENMKSVINAAVKAAGITKVDGTDFTLTLPTESGKKALDASNFPAVDGKTTLDDTEIKKVNDQLNGKILTYKNGVCYYIGRIKHFGDDETKWHLGFPTYNNDNLSWLGRYGVLRNNWYNLYVNSVNGPGEPTVPDHPDTPDDDNYYYINLGVKVLKWAKRGQTLNF